MEDCQIDLQAWSREHFPNNRRQIDSLLHQLAPIKTEPGESLDSRKILFFPNWMITT